MKHSDNIFMAIDFFCADVKLGTRIFSQEAYINVMVNKIKENIERAKKVKSTAGKHYWIDEIDEAWDFFEDELSEYFIRNDNYTRLIDKYTVKDTIIDKSLELPILEMPVAKSDEDFGGLYFLGMIGINPQNKIYYLVKIGLAKNIKKRLHNYYGYNPMLFHNNYSLKIEDETARALAEENCHRYLTSKAYAKAQDADEWYYVDKDTYFELCETFSHQSEWHKISKYEAE